MVTYIQPLHRLPTQSNFTPQLYPLVALVGQERMKTALLLLVIDSNLGGVLLVGGKGTAKSTAVRGLAEIIPMLRAVDGCSYHCSGNQAENMCLDCQRRILAGEILTVSPVATPFLTLPLGATEDRIVGGLDLERSIVSGRAVLQTGLLGQANRGFLYIDEINLLEPYLTHLLLDATESGRLVVEREGVSTWHPAKAALIGTMNPEEGPLGPQLRDRFALVVDVRSDPDPLHRLEIIRRRLAFEADPTGFQARWRHAGHNWQQSLQQARENLPYVRMPAAMEDLIARTAGQSQVPGHRGDMALARASRALAAWYGDREVTVEHLHGVYDLVLASRTLADKTQVVTKVTGQVAGPASAWTFESPYIPGSAPEFRSPGSNTGENSGREPIHRLCQPQERYELVTPTNRREFGPTGRTGRRNARITDRNRGRYYRSSAVRLGRPLAFDATIRAAAPHQSSRRTQNPPPNRESSAEIIDVKPSGTDGDPQACSQYLEEPTGQSPEPILTGHGHQESTATKLELATGRGIFPTENERCRHELRASLPGGGESRRTDRKRFLQIKSQDIREKVFRQKTGRLIVFVVDASGSVGSFHRMSEAKAAAMSLLAEAYKKRDRVALISFNGIDARVLLPPTNSVELADRLLAELPTGGKTPLAAALLGTHRLIRVEMAKDPYLTPLIILMTDGRPNVPLESGADPWRESLSIAAHLGQDRRLRFLVVDTDHGHYADYKLTTDLAQKLSAAKVSLEDLRAGRLNYILESLS